MRAKEVSARQIQNSAGEPTIEISVNKARESTTSAPCGKSTGKFEVKPYKNSLNSDINTINKTIGKNKALKDIEISEFSDLAKIEELIKNKLGANSLYALETSILKALAKEKDIELYELFNKKLTKMPYLVGNAIGGGLHSALRMPDFQEFLFIPETSIKESIDINKKALQDAGVILKNLKKFKGIGRENAWQTALENEQVLVLMQDVKENIIDETGIKLHIGIDIASSSFYNNKTKKYVHKAPKKQLTINQQIDYVNYLIKKYNLFYVEDPLEQNDFKGFSELNKKNKSDKTLIVGDDLTTTSPERLKKAIKNKSINALIVKPNQIGSLLSVREVCELARKNKIKTVFSHRSGETSDSALADLAILFNADFVKTGIAGKEREVKLKRLREIENANL